MPGCMAAMEEALVALARGDSTCRSGRSSSAGRADLARPDADAPRRQRPLYALKTVAIFPDNPSRGLDPHQGTVTLYDGTTGEVTAVMNATPITAIRTAAVSGVATRALARAERASSRRRRRPPGPPHIAAMLEAGRSSASGSPPHARERGAARGRVADRHRRRDARGGGARRRRRLHGDVLRRAGRARRMAASPERTSTPSAPASRTRASSTRPRGAARRSSSTGGSRPRTRRATTCSRSRTARSPRATSGPSSARCSPATPGPHLADDEITVFESLGLAVEDLAAAEYLDCGARGDRLRHDPRVLIPLAEIEAHGSGSRAPP